MPLSPEMMSLVVLIIVVFLLLALITFLCYYYGKLVNTLTSKLMCRDFNQYASFKLEESKVKKKEPKNDNKFVKL